MVRINVGEEKNMNVMEVTNPLPSVTPMTTQAESWVSMASHMRVTVITDGDDR